jgi:ribosomal protein L22
MYFVSGKFKNVRSHLERTILKKEIKNIKNNDMLYLFDDGWCIHRKTNKQIQTSTIAVSNEHEMKKLVKRFFKKASSIIYKASTNLQYTKEDIKAKIPPLVLKHQKQFELLARRGTTKGKHNISLTLLARLLEMNKYHAQAFLQTGINQGIFVQRNSSWSITDDVWNKIRTLYNPQDFTIMPIDKDGNKITRSGHTDSDIAKDIKKVVKKIVSDSENLDIFPNQLTVRRISKKKSQKLKSKLLSPEEAGAEFN